MIEEHLASVLHIAKRVRSHAVTIPQSALHQIAGAGIITVAVMVIHFLIIFIIIIKTILYGGLL